MAINFPLSLDFLSNPSSGNKLDSPSHSTQHGDANDILEALETKLGIGASSAGSATAGFPLVHSSGGTTAWAQVGYEGITSGTATSGQVLTAGTATGSSTWSTPSAGGLVQIVPTSVAVGSGSGSADSAGTITFSGASSASANGVFTSAYRHYRIVLQLTAGTIDCDLNLRMRVSGTDTATNYYYGGNYVIFNGTNGIVNGNNTTQWPLGSIDQSNQNISQSYSMDIFSPQIARDTNIVLQGWTQQTTGNTYLLAFAGTQNTSTQFDGFSVIPSTGVISGIVSVYAYK